MYNILLIHQSKCFTVMVCFIDVLGQYADLSIKEKIQINTLQFIFLSNNVFNENQEFDNYL